MAKKITLGSESLNLIRKGVEEFSKPVTSTLGPKGRTVILHRGLGSPHVTKDGATVAKDVEFENAVMNMAATLTREVSQKTADNAGDGSTTSTLLINSIVSLGSKELLKKSWFPYFWKPKYKFTKVNPNKFKRGLELAKDDIIDKLKTLSHFITDPIELKNIATISCNNDERMGNLLFEIYNKLGYSAKIVRNPDPSTTGEDYISTSQGYTFGKGYASPSFCNKKGNSVAELKNPIFALFPKELKDVEEVLPFLEYSSMSKRPLVVISNSYSEQILSMLINNHLKPTSSLKILAINTPGISILEKEGYLKDIASILNYDLDKTSEELIKENSLGKALRVTSTISETSIILPEEDENEENVLLRNHLKSLEDSFENLSDYELKVTKDRISKLKGKVGVIFLYSKTEGELREREDRLDDAIESTKAAVEEGYIAGGGVPLYRISQDLFRTTFKKRKSNLDKDTLLGYKTLLEAIKMPFKVLVSNGGKNYKKVEREINLSINNSETPLLLYTKGYNPLTDKVENLLSNGIIDPVKVTRLALENAVSTSGSLLTTGCTISLS